MADATEPLTRLVREIRTSFNLLRALAEQLSADLGINPSMRAVLEGLASGEGRTVPDLARERGVSRQHIQTVMNALLEQGLVRAVENPGHKRSVFYRLTRGGAEAFARVRAREAGPLAALAGALPEAEIDQARALIARLNGELESQVRQGDDQ